MRKIAIIVVILLVMMTPSVALAHPRHGHCHRPPAVHARHHVPAFPPGWHATYSYYGTWAWVPGHWVGPNWDSHWVPGHWQWR